MTRAGEHLWYYDLGFNYIGKTTTDGYRVDYFNANDYTTRGMAWDGTYLWALNTFGTIKKYSTSGAMEEVFSGLLSGGWGLTFDGTFLWASDPETDKIYQISIIEDSTPPEAPLITCATHPHESVWYGNPNPIFNWEPPDDPSGISGYSFLLDQTVGTTPDSIIDGSKATATYSSVEDGLWYFHCRARDGAANWGDADHYMIRIDTTPPSNGTIVIAEGADTVNTLIVTLSNLSAEDELSGMGLEAAMKFSNDGLLWSDEEPFADSRVDWNLSRYGGNEPSGIKKAYVIFKDVAGNWSEPFVDEIVYSAPLQIVTESLKNGTVGFTYADTLSASGGWPPYEWEILEGTLPPGLALDMNGIVDGSPNSDGIFSFTVRVTDVNTFSATRGMSITIQSDVVKGDVNGDVKVDVLDLVTVVRYILRLEEFNSQQMWAADVQEDGVINVLDALGIVNIILGIPSVKNGAPHGQAMISLGEIPRFSKGELSVPIVLESPVPVAALQLQILLPVGAELVTPPQSTPQSQLFTVSHRLWGNHLKLILYSLSHETILPDGSLPIALLKLTGGTAPLRIESVTIADENGEKIPTGIKPHGPLPETDWIMCQNYPNPFNPFTDIRYRIQDVGYPVQTTIKVYNLVGQEVSTLVNELKRPGYYTVTWDGRDTNGTPMPSGTYFCRVVAEEMSQTIKMILAR